MSTLPLTPQRFLIATIGFLMLACNTVFGQYTADFTANTQYQCSGGSIDFTDQSTPADSVVGWTWNFGDGTTSTQQNPSHSYSATGVYDVQIIVEFNNGMFDTLLRADYISASGALVPNATLSNVSCYGGSDGSVFATISGGATVNVYIWEEVDPITFQPISIVSNNQNLTGASAGTYKLSYSDDNGCTGSVFYVLSEPAAPIGVTETITHASCAGCSDGAISLAVTGGTPPYSYNWTNPPSAAGNSTSNLPVGTYTVEVADLNGCTVNVSYSVLVDSSNCPSLTIVFDSLNTNLCYGDTTSKVWVTPSGGTAPYTYSWSPYFGSGSTVSDTLKSLGTGCYTVTVTDNNGCAAVDSVCLGYPTRLQIDNIITTNTSCQGCADGVIWVEAVSGGTPPYSYTFFGGPAPATTSVVGDSAYNLQAGTYFINVSDANSCNVGTQSATVQTGGCPSIDIFLKGSLIHCNNNSKIGEADATGGTAPYTFSFTGANGPFGAGGPINSTQTTDTTYHWVWVKDSLGCVDSINLMFPPPDSIDLVLDSVTQPSCATCTDGAIHVSGQNVNVQHAFTWSTGLTENNTSNAASSLTGVSDGTYQVILTNYGGCKDTLDVTLSATSGCTINVDLGADTVLCASSVTFTSTVGGVPPYAYLWSNSAVLPFITVTNSGSYAVTVTDGQGCTGSDTISVTFLSNCGEVWPGDANSDGVANNADVLAVGIGYGYQGPTRPNASLVWVGQQAANWNVFLASGTDLKHADCNGDGIINAADTIAISLNYGLTHPKREKESLPSDPSLYFEFDVDSVAAGQVLIAKVMLGRDTLPVDSAYGIAFSINYNTMLVDSGSAKLDLGTSWLGTQGTDMIGFVKDRYSSSKVDAAITRIDQINRNNGFGQIGAVSMTMKDDISGKDRIQAMLQLYYSDVVLLTATETQVAVNLERDSMLVYDDALGTQFTNRPAEIKIYPNPMNDQLTVYSDVVIEEIKVIDLIGQTLFETTGTISQQTSISTIDWTPGTYLISVRTSRGKVMERILKL